MAISKVLIWVYKEPVHNILQINNIDNEDEKIRDNFYWADRYVNCILKPRIIANLFIIAELKFELLLRRR